MITSGLCTAIKAATLLNKSTESSGVRSVSISSSTRSICMRLPMIRNLVVVILPKLRIIPFVFRPDFVIRFISSSPCLSLPITEQSTTSAPSDLILRATLAAPPSILSRFLSVTTGTGASGEIRSTLPMRYESIITSPITSTWHELNLLNNCEISASVIIISRK